MTETTAPVQSLHDQIMRLPCTPPKDANVNQSISYKSGHRDARHAAAELAAEHEAEQQQVLTAIEAMARMLADGEWAEHVGQLGGPIAQRLETEITRMHNEEQAAPVAVPPAQQPVAVKSHGAWDGLELLAEQPDGTELYAAQPAQPTQADMNAAIDRMRRENNLSIDGDNAYKRDLLDCVIGALAFGKQGSAPPPEDHWLHQFWEIGDAERRERDAAPPAQQSQWVPSRKQLPPLDIPVWLSDEGRGVFIGMRSSSTDGWLWAECDAYRFFGGQWESIEAHFDDFEPSCWMPLPAAPGDAAPLAESGAQVDELAQLVAKLVQALRKANPDAPLAAKAVDYLRRKRLLNPLRDQARGDTAAPEQAEQPHPVNRSVIRDVFLRNGFTIKEGHDDLKPYVYAAAEELLALDGKEVVTEQDAVKVPRGLLERLAAGSHIDPDCCVAYYREQLRALLRGDV